MVNEKAPTPGTEDRTPFPEHNASPQVGVLPNHDPMLDRSNEHTHEHLHHGGAALRAVNEPGAPGQPVYSNGAEIGHDHTSRQYEDHKMGTKEVQSVDTNDESTDRVGGINEESAADIARAERRKKWRIGYWYNRYKPVFHAFWLCVWTVWIGFGLYKRYSTDWLIPFLLYLCLVLRLVTFWIPVKYFWSPVRWVWKQTGSRAHDMIPAKLRKPIAAAITVVVFLIGSLVPEEEGENTRANRAVSLFGLVVMIAVLYATSRDRKLIPWHTVIGGMLSQFIIAVFVLRTQVGFDIFNWISFMARTLLGFANQGVIFLTDDTVPKLPWFFTGVVPPIIFFIALVQLLYYVGFLQWFIGKFAVFFFWTLRVSGAEAVVAAATPFIGQGESAMLIRPFVPHLTLAELHQVMTCGFATIAGSVLIAYIGLGLSPQALVSSCIMSIPASLAVSKMRFPETQETMTSGRVVIPDDEEHKAANALHAFANGAWLGIKIAGMIIATLLCIIAFVGLVNGFLTWWGKYFGIGIGKVIVKGVEKDDRPLTLQLILGYAMFPVAWLLGVPKQDLLPVGELIGVKIVLNEFVAFLSLRNDEAFQGLTERSKLIATYACCGFGNIGSLGTQIGVLSQIAPGRAGDVSRLAVSALISGVLATLTSASVAGMLYTSHLGPAIVKTAGAA